MSATAQQDRAIPVRALIIACGAPAVAIVVYGSYWLLCLHVPAVRAALPIWLGRGLAAYQFNDLDAVLTAIACARQGVDVTVPNACMGGGLFQYSPLLLKAADLPIGRGQYALWGLGLDAIFLLSLYTLPPPRRWREFWCLLLAVLSCSTYWALESANIDVGIYLLVLLAAHLLLRGANIRLAGYATLLLAAAIKFYPACLLVLAVRERPARFVPIALASLAAAVLFAIAFAGQMGHILPRLPQGDPFAGTFAASNLPEGIARMMTGGVTDSPIDGAIRLGSMLGLILLCALIVRQWMPALLPMLRSTAPRRRTLLVAGAVSTTFCFLTAHNFLHREIFLILTLPGFWDMERRAPDRALRARALLASWVIIGLMWSFYFLTWLVAVKAVGLRGQLVSTAIAFIWLLRELLWWWLIGLFAAIILCFLWDAPLLAHWRLKRTRSAG